MYGDLSILNLPGVDGILSRCDDAICFDIGFFLDQEKPDLFLFFSFFLVSE